MRARSVSAVSSAQDGHALLARSPAPVSTPSSTSGRCRRSRRRRRRARPRSDARRGTRAAATDGVDDPAAEAVEERLAEAGACSRRSTTSSTPCSCEPVGHARRRAPSRLGVVVELEDGGRDAGVSRPRERARAGGSTRRRRSAGPRRCSACRFVPSPLTRTPITRSARSRARRARLVRTTAQKPMPRLKTRRSSSSSTWRASHANTGGRSHASQSISARRPSGRTRSRLPAMPPPVTCAKARARPRSRRTTSR